MKKVLFFRKKIKTIVNGKSNKFLIITGPCSIHNYISCKKYYKFLKKETPKYKNLFIIMRFYLEKPRTTVGWKGFVYDPDLNNSFNYKKGIYYSKFLLKKMYNTIPLGTEFLSPYIFDVIKKYFCFGAIGARTTESQLHREMAAKVNYCVGFKNALNGEFVFINSLIAVKQPSVCVNYCVKSNKANLIKTKGNFNCLSILRGGNFPNYKINNIIELIYKQIKNKINKGIIIDLSHGNSIKKYNNQIFCFNYVIKIILFFPQLSGVMIESHLKSGVGNLNSVNKSITDSCISIKNTKKIIKNINLVMHKRKSYY